MDAGQSDSIQATVDYTTEQSGTSMALVHNVGLTSLHKELDVMNLDLEEWDRFMV
ncbi:hypothetical protein [Bacillus sp. SD075]|uniref:hypothetical protein n=1 Tax=Bacillus sp. SD075 TaxID=2781732 RepID=UPI00257047BD|nr:hypothetical protein [Bacillus sp. SD075]